MEGDPRHEELVHGGFVVSLRLLPSSLNIDVRVRADRRLFYTNISRDSMTEELNEIFGGQCSKIFNFIVAGNFELEDPSQLILVIRIVMMRKRIPIHLAERALDPRQLALERRVEELEDQIRRVEGQRHELHNEVEEIRRQLAEEQEQRRQRDRQIARLQQQLQEREKKVSTLHDQSKEREAKMVTLQKQLEIREKDMAKLQEQSKKKQGNNIELRKQLQMKQTRVVKLQNSLRESDKSNQQLNRTISQLKQSRQQDRLNYEATFCELQQQLATAQHQSLSTGQKGAKKQEVMKPNKQTPSTKLVTIKGIGYGELSEKVASANDKKSITELRLENTVLQLLQKGS